MISPFNALRNLPPGSLEATGRAFTHRFGMTLHRRVLLAGLNAALEALHAASRRSYINGSFVTAKRGPNGYDECWDNERANPDRLGPLLLTFDRG